MSLFISDGFAEVLDDEAALSRIPETRFRSQGHGFYDAEEPHRT